MSQENSGQISSEQLDKILDEYNSNNKVGAAFSSGEVSEYLNMTRDQIESMSREDRCTASIQLSQYAIYLQRLVNREKARLSWSNAIINKLGAAHWEQFDKFLSYEIKIAKISKEYDLMDKSIKIRNHAQIRIDELDSVANLIKHLSDMMMRSTYGT